MKKVVLASFLACAAIASGLPSAFAQNASAAGGAQATTTANGQVQMPAAEYAVYNNAMTQATPQAKAAALEAYLTQFPQSAVKEQVLETIMVLDYSIDPAKALDVADRILQLDPTDIKAQYVETLVRKSQADALTGAAQQTAMDSVASYAQKGLAAPKPKDMSDADFDKLKAAQYPTFYSDIGYDALLKKDSAGAIDAYKKELALVSPDATKTPGPVLQDIFYLGDAYYEATPPDYLDCSFYASRAVAYAPEPYKTQFAKIASYCYKKFHGVDDGYNAVLAAATANLNPPDGLFASIKPAPTPADIIAGIITSTPDLSTLATSDKEYILQNGTPDQADKVWQTMKGKSYQFPGALVIASTPAQLQVALSDDAVTSKTADFTFNLTPPEPVPDLKEHATAVEKERHAKEVKKAADDADAMAKATAVGQTVTLSGTFDSYTPKPLMITMTDGAVVLPKAAAPKAPVHHRPAAH